MEQLQTKFAGEAKPQWRKPDQSYYNDLRESVGYFLQEAIHGFVSDRCNCADMATQDAQRILYTWFDPQKPPSNDFRPNIDPIAFANEVIEGLHQIQTDPLYKGKELIESYIRILEAERDYIRSGGTMLMIRDTYGLPYVHGPDQQRGAFYPVEPMRHAVA